MDSPSEYAPQAEHSVVVRGLKERITNLEQNVAGVLKLVGDQGVCRGEDCHAPIWWVNTKRGGKMCYDVDGTPHWGTCKNSKDFKRSGGG